MARQSKRRAAMLALVLATLALSITLVAPLAMRTGTTAIEASRDAGLCRHELAVDSVVLVLPNLLAKDRDLKSRLDRMNAAELRLEIGQVRVNVVIQDDSAKLPLAALRRPDKGPAEPLNRLLANLGHEIRARSANATALHRYLQTGCLEDCLDRPSDRQVYTAENAFAKFVTPLTGRINFKRASLPALVAALDDAEPGLAQQVINVRSRADSVAELHDQLDLTEPAANRISTLLTHETTRYSLLIETTVGDRSNWSYLICTNEDPATVLARWQVHP